MIYQIAARPGMVIDNLAEQPVLALLLRAWIHPHQQPFALHPLAVQDEMQMPFLQCLARVLAGDRLPGAVIPQHHRPAAIFLFGNRTLEIAISERVILGPHRQPLVLGIETWPLRHRPAFQDTVQLQPEIIMEAGGVMLLDDEALPTRPPALPLGLARLAEIALGVVRGERIGHLQPPAPLTQISLPFRGGMKGWGSTEGARSP